MLVNNCKLKIFLAILLVKKIIWAKNSNLKALSLVKTTSMILIP